MSDQDGNLIQRNILLVEDNPGDVRLLEEALRETGIEDSLDVARDGVEALEYLQREGQFNAARYPDLILLDLDLPRKNGKEVLAEIKEDPEFRRIPVIVLSTSAAENDISAAYDLHGNCYIVKPNSFDRFEEIVRFIQDFWLHGIQSGVRLPPAPQG